MNFRLRSESTIIRECKRGLNPLTLREAREIMFLCAIAECCGRNPRKTIAVSHNFVVTDFAAVITDVPPDEPRFPFFI